MCCPVRLPSSIKEPGPCLPLACGFWKLWPDGLFVLQPHTRPYFSQSLDSSAEPVTRRRPWRLRSPGRRRPGGRWVLHPQKPVVLRARPADPEGGLVSNIPAVASRSSGSLTAARAALRRSIAAPAWTMPLLYPKPNPLQKANLCSRLFFW